MNLLTVTASPRGDSSSSRRLALAFARDWLAAGPGRASVLRDLAAEPADGIDAAWIAANYADPGVRTRAMCERLAPSDRLIDELIAADRLVIAAPMYNFSVPAALKAWIDQVTRIGRTFVFHGPWRFEGLAGENRAAMIVMTSSTDWSTPPADGREDHCVSYLRSWLRFLGFKNIDSVNVAYQLRAGPSKDDALRQGEDTLRARAAAW